MTKLDKLVDDLEDLGWDMSKDEAKNAIKQLMLELIDTHSSPWYAVVNVKDLRKAIEDL